MKVRWDLVALAYVALAVVGAMLSAILCGGNPWLHPCPWYAMTPLAREVGSIGLGFAFATFVALSTRICVSRAAWARQLYQDLRPVTSGMTAPTILLVAVLSSIGEELFFRAFLNPLVGVGIQAVIFGLGHQMRGPSRWVWVAWAGCVGLALGVLHSMFGTLSGPVIAHMLVNTANLFYLRHHDFELGTTRMGGLLRDVPDESRRAAG